MTKVKSDIDIMLEAGWVPEGKPTIYCKICDQPRKIWISAAVTKATPTAAKHIKKGYYRRLTSKSPGQVKCLCIN